MADKPRFDGERVPFADAFTEASRGVKKFRQGEYAEIGKHPIVDQGQEVIAGYSDEEDGLFTNVPAIVFGDHTRCFKYVEEPFFVGADGVKILKPKLSSNVRFWWHALKATPIENLGYSRHFKLLRAANFYVFDSEQQEMVTSNLDAVLEQISQAEAQIEQLDQLVKSRFVEMFGGSEWPSKSIGELATDIRYGTSKKASERGEHAYLRMNNMTDDGKLDFADVKYIDLSEDELTKCQVVDGDLLFNRTNSREKVGKTAVFHGHTPMVIAGYIIRVRLGDEVRSDYLSTFMNLTSTKAMLRTIAKGAVHQANINSKELAALKVPVAPIELQDRFLAFVAQVDKSRFVVLNEKISRIQLISRRIAHRFSR